MKKLNSKENIEETKNEPKKDIDIDKKTNVPNVNALKILNF